MRFQIQMRYFLFITSLGAGLMVIAQARAESLLLAGGTIHTVAGPTIALGDVLVQDGKITGVFDASQPIGKTYPADTKRIDLGGQHLYPGMIALDVDMGLTEIEAARATRDLTEVGEYTPEVQSWQAVNPDSELLPVARANGVAYFEPSPRGAVVAGQSGLVALDGWTTEQMVYRRHMALHVYWPTFELNTTPKERMKNKDKWKSLDEQAKNRRESVKALEDFFEEAAAYEKAKKASADKPFPQVPAWEAMLPYVSGELPIVVHGNELRQIQSIANWAMASRRRIVLSGGRDAWRVADLLATNQIPVIYRHVFTQPGRETDGYDAQFHAPEKLRQAGVKVVFGLSGSSDSLVKNLPYEVAQAVAFGFPEDEALKAITLYPAQLAGVADHVGSIEAGKDATLFVSDGDILDIRSNVNRMWIAGKEVSLESRHTRFYEKYRARPKAK